MSDQADDAFGRAAARIAELWAGYEPPGFGHVPDADSALFLCAIDHQTGYRDAHLVEGRGPFAGSELMWAVGLSAARRRPRLLTAAALTEIDDGAVAEAFRIDRETVADPGRRASLWRQLAVSMEREYSGEAGVLLAAARSRLAGARGLLARLATFDAYSDPLAKKSQLFAKICARRGWFEVRDPESWTVSADNVLMRLALRAGLVAEGDLARVRAGTRDAFERLAEHTGIAPPLLDDMLWELGRADADLLGAHAGDLSEPPRDPGSAWY